MARGYKCPSCGKSVGARYNGAYRCGDDECSAIWWGPFDKPSAGKPQKGYRCRQCRRQTLHWLAEMDGITIWRCSTCAAAVLEHTQ